MRTPTRILAVASVAALAFGAAGCASQGDEPDDEKTHLIFGFNPGPYRDYVEQAIFPLLEEEGYTTESVEFTDGIITNVAVSDGEVDAIVMQHVPFMESVNEQEGLTNAALVPVPTPPMSLFAGQADGLDDVAAGSTVAVPNQPVNMYRAFRVLENIGWLELSETIDPGTASPADIVENVHDVQIVPMENAQQVAALQDVDFDVIQGNFVISGGLDLGEALALEDLGEQFRNVVTVDESNLDTPWAQAIADAFVSPEFAEYITSNPDYEYYYLPDELVAAAE